MADKPLELPMDRFTRRSSPTGGMATDGCFESGDGPALMLDLVLTGGDRIGLPYSYLSGVRLQGGERVELEFAGRRVMIDGRNLIPLYNQLLAHQVWRIAAAASPFDDGAASCWVKSIKVVDADTLRD